MPNTNRRNGKSKYPLFNQIKADRYFRFIELPEGEAEKGKYILRKWDNKTALVVSADEYPLHLNGPLRVGSFVNVRTNSKVALQTM